MLSFLRATCRSFAPALSKAYTGMPKIDLPYDEGLFHARVVLRDHLVSKDIRIVTPYTHPSDLPNILQSAKNALDLSEILCVKLPNKGLQTLPPELFYLPNIERIDVSENEITYLPELTKISKLTHFFLSNNQLSSLPDSFANLRYLTKFNCAFNRFEELPPPLLKISTLSSLVFTNNTLHELTETIPKCFPNLRELIVQNCNLNKLPESIGQLSNLLRLDISNNQIESLPPSFTMMRKLQILFMHNNRIQTLPPGFNSLKQLRLIELANNQFLSPPTECIHLPYLSQD